MPCVRVGRARDGKYDFLVRWYDGTRVRYSFFFRGKIAVSFSFFTMTSYRISYELPRTSWRRPLERAVVEEKEKDSEKDGWMRTPPEMRGKKNLKKFSEQKTKMPRRTQHPLINRSVDNRMVEERKKRKKSESQGASTEEHTNKLNQSRRNEIRIAGQPPPNAASFPNHQRFRISSREIIERIGHT